MTIQHDIHAQQFTIAQASHTAELAYARPDAHTIDFTHTFVDEALRGHGLAEALARAGLAYARAHKLEVKTSCQFMAAFVQKHGVSG